MLASPAPRDETDGLAFRACQGGRGEIHCGRVWREALFRLGLEIPDRLLAIADEVIE
jgi:hypothetical protein